MRVATRLLSALVALGLATARVIVAVEIIVAGLDRPPWLLRWHRWTLGHTWTAGSVRAALCGLCAAGVVLLVLAGARQRPIMLDIEMTRRGPDAQVRRSSVEATLRRVVERIDGVAAAGVRVSGGKDWVKAHANSRDIAGLRETLSGVVSERLDQFRLATPPEIRVDVAPRSR